MNCDLLIKCGSGLVALGGVLYTIISIKEKRKGPNMESPYGTAALGKQIENGNARLLEANTRLVAEISNLNVDVDKSMDALSKENSAMITLLNDSNVNGSKEQSYLRGLTTHTHNDVELMKWHVDFSGSDIDICIKELVASGHAGPRSLDETDEW
jgi:hypothetical protein